MDRIMQQVLNRMVPRLLVGALVDLVFWSSLPWCVCGAGHAAGPQSDGTSLLGTARSGLSAVGSRRRITQTNWQWPVVVAALSSGRVMCVRPQQSNDIVRGFLEAELYAKAALKPPESKHNIPVWLMFVTCLL